MNPIQLLADDFARNGFKVYAPELFEGDPVAPDAFTTACHAPLDMVGQLLALLRIPFSGDFRLSPVGN